MINNAAEKYLSNSRMELKCSRHGEDRVRLSRETATSSEECLELIGSKREQA